MNAARIRAVLWKEWIELRQSKSLLSMMALLPTLLGGATLGIAWMVDTIPDAAFRDLEAMGESRGMHPRDVMGVLLDDQFLLLMLLVPMAMPSAITSYAIAGERETRSLEALLSTPLTTAELLLGKAIAACTPAVLLGWLSYVAVAAIGSTFMSPVIFANLVRPAWTIGMVLLAPLLAMLGTLTGLIASSRLPDPRAAQSVTAIFIVPLVGTAVSTVLGYVRFDLQFMLVMASGLILFDVALLYVAQVVFQRDRILSKWR